MKIKFCHASEMKKKKKLLKKVNSTKRLRFDFFLFFDIGSEYLIIFKLLKDVNEGNIQNEERVFFDEM